MFMRQVRIIVCGLGFAICVAGTVHAFIYNQTLSSSVGITQSPAPTEAMPEANFGATLTDDKAATRLILELKSQRQYAANLHAALKETLISAQERALVKFLLWAGAAVLFGILLFSVGGRRSAS